MALRIDPGQVDSRLKSLLQMVVRLGGYSCRVGGRAEADELGIDPGLRYRDQSLLVRTYPKGPRINLGRLRLTT